MPKRGEGAPTAAAPPEVAIVVSPSSLAGTLAVQQGRWFLTAPDHQTLAAVRAQFGLADDAPIPVVLSVSYRAGTLAAEKTVWLGEAADNPAIESVTIADQVAAEMWTMLGILHALQ